MFKKIKMYKKENFHVKNSDGKWSKYSYNANLYTSDKEEIVQISIFNQLTNVKLSKQITIDSLLKTSEFSSLVFEEVAEIILDYVINVINQYAGN